MTAITAGSYFSDISIFPNTKGKAVDYLQNNGHTEVKVKVGNPLHCYGGGHDSVAYNSVKDNQKQTGTLCVNIYPIGAIYKSPTAK